MPDKHSIVTKIDQTKEIHASNEFPFRPHLGGSFIGRPCSRQLFYNFRWAVRPKHPGRILRLFERGHREEFSFVSYFRLLGIEVREYSERLWYHPESDSYTKTPWEPDTSLEASDLERVAAECVEVTGDAGHVERAELAGTKLTQWRISDVRGHFGGSLDGEAISPFEIDANKYEWSNAGPIPADEKFLLEFKTHNTKSFTKLVVEGVKKAKPEHYYQMQIYMRKRGLRFALYMAVNKNDDDLFAEVVELDPVIADALLEKAGLIIDAKTPGRRLHENPAMFECKFCDYAQVCHFGAPMDKNCRTCINSEPVENSQWRCNHWNAIIPSSDAQLKGCQHHKQITD